MTLKIAGKKISGRLVLSASSAGAGGFRAVTPPPPQPPAPQTRYFGAARIGSNKDYLYLAPTGMTTLRSFETGLRQPLLTAFYVDVTGYRGALWHFDAGVNEYVSASLPGGRPHLFSSDPIVGTVTGLTSDSEFFALSSLAWQDTAGRVLSTGSMHRGMFTPEFEHESVELLDPQTGQKASVYSPYGRFSLKTPANQQAYAAVGGPSPRVFFIEQPPVLIGDILPNAQQKLYTCDPVTSLMSATLIVPDSLAAEQRNLLDRVHASYDEGASTYRTSIGTSFIAYESEQGYQQRVEVFKHTATVDGTTLELTGTVLPTEFFGRTEEKFSRDALHYVFGSKEHTFCLVATRDPFGGDPKIATWSVTDVSGDLPKGHMSGSLIKNSIGYSFAAFDNLSTKSGSDAVIALMFISNVGTFKFLLWKNPSPSSFVEDEADVDVPLTDANVDTFDYDTPFGIASDSSIDSSVWAAGTVGVEVVEALGKSATCALWRIDPSTGASSSIVLQPPDRFVVSIDTPMRDAVFLYDDESTSPSTPYVLVTVAGVIMPQNIPGLKSTPTRLRDIGTGLKKCIVVFKVRRDTLDSSYAVVTSTGDEGAESIGIK